MRQAAYRAVALFQKHPELPPHLPMFRDKMPIAWRQDSLALIIRKLARQVASSRPVLLLMEKLVAILKQRYPVPFLLDPLCRWIKGGYVFRGYREGLCEYGSVKG